jgi:hypothetical protein
MQAPLWNGRSIAGIEPADMSSYVLSLGFTKDRDVDHGGETIFWVYKRGDLEIWVPMQYKASDFKSRVCNFINNIALIEECAQVDVYETLVWKSRIGCQTEEL